MREERLADDGVAVQRDDDAHSGLVGDAGQGPADLRQVRPGLAAVRGGQDDPARVAVEVVQGRVAVTLGAAAGPAQGVDDGVAGDGDRVGGDALAQQVRQVAGGGGQVEGGDLGDEPSVALLGEGRAEPAAAQSGLDVDDGDPLVESGQGSGEGGGRVAVDQDRVGGRGGEVVLQAAQRAVGDLGEGLLGGHHFQVDVGGEAEGVEGLVQHLAVLPGGDHDGLEARVVLEGADDGRELDGFRPGAEDYGDGTHGFLYFLTRWESSRGGACEGAARRCAAGLSRGGGQGIGSHCEGLFSCPLPAKTQLSRSRPGSQRTPAATRTVGRERPKPRTPETGVRGF